MTVGLHLADARIKSTPSAQYFGVITDTGTTVEKGEPDEGPAAIIEATAGAWKACIFAGLDPADAAGVMITGDPAAARLLATTTRFAAH